MNSSELQVQIFKYIKNRLPAHLSIADDVANALEISTDSAYRRIRGEKNLSLEEVHKLCVRYHLSLDNLLNLQSNAFVFTGTFVNPDDFRYDEYLSSIVGNMKGMSGFKERLIIYLSKDIPLFHHFHFKELASFKYYFWMKNVLQQPAFGNKKFSVDDYPEEYYAIGRQTLEYYNKINSIELWNLETINSTIRQIEYYHDLNIFSSEEEIYKVYTALEKLLSHLELQATAGFKFNPGDNPSNSASTYQMYFNEILILDNSILAILDGSKSTFLLHNVLNYMMTRDERFCDNMHRNIQNLLKKSTLISSSSERERSRFFKFLRRKIEHQKQNLKI
jgi:hypothetical protein